MNKFPVIVDPSLIPREALNLMEEKRITTLVVVDYSAQLMGYINLHDILRKIDK